MYQDLQPNIAFVSQYDEEIGALMDKEISHLRRSLPPWAPS